MLIWHILFSRHVTTLFRINFINQFSYFYPSRRIFSKILQFNHILIWFDWHVDSMVDCVATTVFGGQSDSWLENDMKMVCNVNWFYQCQNIYQNSLVLCAVLRNVWGPLAPNPSMSRYHMWQLSPFSKIEIKTNNSRGNCSAWDEVLHSKIDIWPTPRNLTSSLKPPNVKAPSQCVHVPSGVLRHAEVIRSLRSKIGARPIFASFGIVL